MSFSKPYNSSLQTLTLPQHIIFEEILPKLPAKSLIRFKSVSKSWFSTISSPEFAKLHLQFSSSCSIFLMLTKFFEDYSIEVDEDVKHDIFFIRYNEFDCEIKDLSRLEFRSCPISRNEIVDLLGSCNGLVCLWMLNYIICWNPVTNQVRQIDHPSAETFTELFAAQFSYASSNDEYRLFATFFSEDEDDFLVYCYMFSWSTGEWKRYIDLSNHCSKLRFRGVVLTDEIVYLLYPGHIIGFGLANEEISESPPLDWLSTYRKWSSMELRGCLTLICFTNDNVCDVWMLKRHFEWNSWEKLFSVNFANVNFYGLSRTGKCLVKHEGKLKVVDPSRGNAAQELLPMGIDFDNEYYIYYGMLNSQDYVESLVSPF